MERSHSQANPTSQYPSPDLIPKSSSLFVNSDDPFSCQPSHDSFLIPPNPHHHVMPPPPQYYHASLDAPYALAGWREGPSPPLPPPRPPPYISFGISASMAQISHEEARKKMHREIERQRRRWMNSLFCSLRSLLPLESVKGKRSTSDHMDVAFDYISDLRVRIKGLEAKRDKLLRKSSFVALHQKSSVSEASPVNCFTVNPYLDGIEVVIRGEFSEQYFPLSRVLQLLAHEGVSVVHCMYTRNNDITIYTITSEGCDPGSFDIAGLQWKLGELLNL